MKEKDALEVKGESIYYGEVPSDEEFWTVAQRYFSFEEPSSRWSKQRKSLQKQLKRVKSNSAELDSMTLVERSSIFSQIFGNGNSFDTSYIEELTGSLSGQTDKKLIIGKINELVSALFAYEDLRRFRQLAFDSWRVDQSLNPLEKRFPFVKWFSKKHTLNESELVFLQYSQLCCLNWARLLNPGPWLDDPIREFLVEFMLAACSYIAKTAQDSNLNDKEDYASLLNLWIDLLKRRRALLPGHFLPEILILVEGQSEELLLPRFAELKNADFNELAVEVRSCGGAKQVVRQHLNLRDVIELPIVAILDSDVIEEAEILKESLRDIDKLQVLTSGELEDSYSNQAFIKLINHYIASLGSSNFLSVDNLKNSGQRVKQMTAFWRQRKLGNFDKIEFSKLVYEKVEPEDVPEEFELIIKSVIEATGANGKFRFS